MAQIKEHCSKLYDEHTSLEEFTKLVTSGKFDINSNMLGFNALHASLRFPAKTMTARIGLLLKHGINVNSVDHRTPHKNPPLHAFIVNEKVADVLYFIDEAKRLELPLDYNQTDVEGKTTLILAAKVRREVMALHILENAADNLKIDAQDNDGMTAAHYACALGLPKLLEALIKKNANLTLEDKKKRKPIEYTNASDDEISTILNSVSVNPERDENAIVNNVCDENLQEIITLDLTGGITPHEVLSNKTNRGQIEKLLQLPIVDSTVVHSLTQMTLRGNNAIAYLIAHQLNQQQKQNILKQFDVMSGVTVIQVVKRNQAILREILIKNGVAYDRLIRFYAANNKSEQLVSLLSLPDIAKHISQPGLPSGKTALHHAATKGLTDICVQLIKAQASLNCQDTDGNTPLLLACHAKKGEVVLLLIQKGADVSLKNKQGINIFQMLKNGNQSQLQQKVLDELHKLNQPPIALNEAEEYRPSFN